MPGARKAYKAATQHFKLGEYEPALEQFKEAFRLHEDPSFLFNIGQCQRLLGRRTEAIASFRAYLNDSKNAANREEVEAVITKLREELAAEEAERRRKDEAAAEAAAAARVIPPPVAVVEQPPPPPPKTPLYKKWWLWTAVGAVVAVGVGVGLGVGLTRPAYPHASSTDGSFHF